MHAAREILDGGLLAAQVIDADLGVGHSATEAGLGVRLVLAVAVTVGESGEGKMWAKVREDVFTVSVTKS